MVAILCDVVKGWNLNGDDEISVRSISFFFLFLFSGDKLTDWVTLFIREVFE